MSNRIRINGVLFEAIDDEDYPKDLVNDIVKILHDVDIDTLISAWNDACDWGDDSYSKIWSMDDFDDEFEDESPREVAEMIWKAGKRFNPFASYFWYETKEDHLDGTIVTGNSVKDLSVDYNELAKTMIDAEDGFGIFSIDKLF